MVCLICRGCGGTDTRCVVDLGQQPASDDFPAAGSPGPDAVWPLQLWICANCALVQLGPVLALLEEPVRAVESQTSQKHAQHMAGSVLADYPQLRGASIREFASHHGGSWLEALTDAGCTLAAPDEPALLVVDAHALPHEQDVAGWFAQLTAAMAPDAVLVVEHHHLLPLVTEGQFDTIRHGHWTYLSLTAVARIGAMHGLQVIRATPEPVFGGSLRVELAREEADFDIHPSVAEILDAERAAGLDEGSGLEGLAKRAHVTAAEIRDYLREQKQAGRRVLGYGAPSKAAILLGVSEVDQQLLEFTVDAAPLKHGLVIPGVRVPIRPVAELAAARPDVVLILTWDIADEVVGQLEAAGGWGAEYVLPLPAPHTFTVAAGRTS
jgi:hypothetical protein